MPFIECLGCGWRLNWNGSYESPKCYNMFCTHYDPSWSAETLAFEVTVTNLTSSLKTLAVKWNFTYDQLNPVLEKDPENENTE